MVIVKKLFTFCAPYLKKFRWQILGLMLLYIASGLLSVVLPYISGSYVDALIGGTAVSRMEFYLLLIAALALIQLVLGYVCERLYIHVQCRGGHALNADAVHRIQNMPFRFMQEKNTMFLTQQINNDANAVIIFCITVLQNIVTNALTLLLPLIMIASKELWLGVAMLGINLVYYGLYQLFKGGVYRTQRAFMNEQADYFSKLGTQLSNVKFIQTQGLASAYIQRLTGSLEKLIHTAYKTQQAQYAFSGSDVIIKYGANILVFVLGGFAVLRGSMTVGEFTIIQSYFSMTLGATQYFFSLGKSIQSAKVSCDRLTAIFNEREQTNGTRRLADIKQISCKAVRFGYGEEKVLSERSEVFEKGHIYAFVGENGAGKSTFINLLLGLFIDQYEGTVQYNGLPIEELDMRTLRRELVGVSEQEPMLLEDTLRFNLTFDDEASVDEAEFQKLCGILNLDALLRSLPEGLDTVVREGTSNLSGGEKQKLSIIRALLKQPKLLVLDEPTSALDRESTKKFIEYLSAIREDKIIFVSTHDEALLNICSATIRLQKHCA